jgi:hypothetical protein
VNRVNQQVIFQYDGPPLDSDRSVEAQLFLEHCRTISTASPVSLFANITNTTLILITLPKSIHQKEEYHVNLSANFTLSVEAADRVVATRQELSASLQGCSLEG